MDLAEILSSTTKDELVKDVLTLGCWPSADAGLPCRVLDALRDVGLVLCARYGAGGFDAALGDALLHAKSCEEILLVANIIKAWLPHDKSLMANALQKLFSKEHNEPRVIMSLGAPVFTINEMKKLLKKPDVDMSYWLNYYTEISWLSRFLHGSKTITDLAAGDSAWADLPFCCYCRLMSRLPEGILFWWEIDVWLRVWRLKERVIRYPFVCRKDALVRLSSAAYNGLSVAIEPVDDALLRCFSCLRAGHWLKGVIANSKSSSAGAQLVIPLNSIGPLTSFELYGTLLPGAPVLLYGIGSK